MRIDNIQLPLIDSSMKIGKEEVSTYKSNSKERSFSKVLDSKREQQEVNSQPKVENNVENNSGDVDNFKALDNKVSVKEENVEVNESEIEEIIDVIYPVVIEFIKFYKADLAENNTSLSNGIVIGESPEELKNMISEFVDNLSNINNIKEKIETTTTFNTEISEESITVTTEENKALDTKVENVFNSSIDNEKLTKEFVKSLIEKVVTEVNSINKPTTKGEFRIIDSQYGVVEKNIEEALTKLTSEDEIKVLVKNTLKEVIKSDSSLKENKLVAKKSFESYIPTKHVYLRENGEVQNVKVNEVQSQELKAVAVSTSDEEVFLKSLIDGEEKTRNTDVILRNDTKIFTPLTESNKTEESPVVNRETMIKDVVKAIKYMERNAQKELTVKIYPKELGEISIKIIAGAAEGGIKASISATSKETYAILNSNINELKQSIANSEIKISEVNISLYNQDTTFHRDETNQGYENKNGQNVSKDNSDYNDNDEIDSMPKDSNPLGNLSMLV